MIDWKASLARTQEIYILTLALLLHCAALDLLLDFWVSLFSPSDTTKSGNGSTETYYKWESNGEERLGLTPLFMHHFIRPWNVRQAWLYVTVSDRNDSCFKLNNVMAHSWNRVSLRWISILCELKGYSWSHIVNFLRPRIPFNSFVELRKNSVLVVSSLRA